MQETGKHHPYTRKNSRQVTIWESDHIWKKEKRLHSSHYIYVHKTKETMVLKVKTDIITISHQIEKVRKRKKL